mgnify:CR=1 FL=1
MHPKSVVVAALVLLSTSALAGPPPGRGPAPRDVPARHAAVPGEDAVQDLHRSLDRLRRLSRELRNQELAERIRVEIAVAERDLARLDRTRWDLIDTASAFESEALECARQLDRARPPRAERPGHGYREPWYPEPEPVPVVVVTSPPELAGIHRAVKDAAFSREKLAVLGSAVGDRWFTAQQVVQLLGAFDFEKDKVEAAVLLHPHVVDPENWFQVYGAFDFDANKRKVRERVGQ